MEEDSILTDTFANPFKVDLLNNLSQDEVLSAFKKIRKKISNISETGPALLPPVLPKAGSLYVYYLGTDSSTWEKKKKQLR